jgi:hypothetical protein
MPMSHSPCMKERRVTLTLMCRYRCGKERRLSRLLLTKHYPPDVGAAKYWLNNRQPERWRNQVEIEVSRPSAAASVEVLDAIYEAGIQHAQQSREEMQLRRLQLAQDVVQVSEH